MQSTFVPHRLITDNAIVTFESFHNLLIVNKVSFQFMGLKLDMRKTYDRIEWDYLLEVRSLMGFPDRFRDWIHSCLSFVSFSIILNGQATPHFSPSRGLSQGDPISPFLFIICAEGLSAMPRQAKDRLSFHGLPFGNGQLRVSHLFYLQMTVVSLQRLVLKRRIIFWVL